MKRLRPNVAAKGGQNESAVINEAASPRCWERIVIKMEGEAQTEQSIKAELSVFDDHSFQVTHLKAQWAEILPLNQYAGTDQTTIIFRIPQAEGWYMDFNDAFAILEVSIVKADGKKI